MKLKSLLLGSAAAVALATGAQAADLPGKGPVAVDYVKVCDAFGAGFYYIPGTDTCIRIGGYVRAQYYMHDSAATAERWDSARDINLTGSPSLTESNYATRARAQLNVDARSQTEYGTLRGFMALRTEFNSDNGSLSPSIGNTSNRAFLLQGFVQFAGLTAGRAYSFFQFSHGHGNYSAHLRYGENDETVNLLAYTFNFGNGVTATLSLEDANVTDAGFWNAGTGILAGGTSFVAARTEMPDVVANLRIDQAWGAAQLAGVVRQVKGYHTSTTTTAAPAFVTTSVASEQEIGWAIGAGLKINLPMLAKGDSFSISGAYGDGASMYSGNFIRDGFLKGSSQLTSSLETLKAWSVMGSLQHYWAPNLNSTFAVSYGQADVGAGDALFATANIGTATQVTKSALMASANLVWNPVKNLDVGVEVLYANRDGFYVNGAGAANVYAKDQDVWGGMLRIQRNF